ncbi:MAG TPA: hypothetical protein VK824_04810 [Planctomycetota bacterium]|nr:hypothetical protein [Planctomycetota bacterium]
MKPAIKALLCRTSLALLTLTGGLPPASLFAKGVLTQGSGRPPAQVGSDGVGGIERSGPISPSTKGGSGAAGPLHGTDIAAVPNPWTDLGATFAGADGSPVLTGTGTAEAGSMVTITLSDAKPGAAAALVIGVALANVPFKGGTMIPAPMLLLPGLPVSAAGSLALPAVLPAALPSGFQLYMQMWIPDGSAAHGFASSNGLGLLIP